MVFERSILQLASSRGKSTGLGFQYNICTTFEHCVILGSEVLWDLVFSSETGGKDADHRRSVRRGGQNLLMWHGDWKCSPLILSQCYYLWWMTVNSAGSKQGHAQRSAGEGTETDGHTAQGLFNKNSPLHRQWGQRAVTDHSGNGMLSHLGGEGKILLHTLH